MSGMPCVECRVSNLASGGIVADARCKIRVLQFCNADENTLTRIVWDTVLLAIIFTVVFVLII